jgi:hypothetical protein
MPDILGGSYYGNETYSDIAPGGAWDVFIGYDSYAPHDGYIAPSNAQVFDAFGETIEWGGGSDPYQSPVTSTSDIIRSRATGVPYPAAPINYVPGYTAVDAQSDPPGAWGGIFKSVVDVFGKSAIVLAGTLGAQALERSIPGRPASDSTRAGAPAGLPARPFVLPSFLGGGTFSPTSGNIMIAVIAAGVGLLLLALFARR